jgi:hypothetical protein
MSEPATSAEYERFKNLLTRVLSVPHSEIVKREAEYRRQSKLNPKRRGPKPKRKN